MRHVLAILCLALAGCVTVQPCVCPTPAPKVEPPASGFVYDGAIEGHTLPHVPKTGITLTQPGSVWYDGCNWHRPLGYGLEGVTLMGCNLDTSLTLTPPAADPGTSNWVPIRPGEPKGPTGLDVAKWMIARDKAQPGWMPRNFSYSVHSQNPNGARFIDELMRQYLRRRQH